jgi:hypothetical protein
MIRSRVYEVLLGSTRDARLRCLARARSFRILASTATVRRSFLGLGTALGWSAFDRRLRPSSASGPGGRWFTCGFFDRRSRRRLRNHIDNLRWRIHFLNDIAVDHFSFSR